MSDRDDPPDHAPTLLAAGLLAYVAETLLHEALGHGGACLASGARVTMLAPLWMRCSETSAAMIAAGPAANFIGAAMVWSVLRWAPPRSALVGLLLWLSFAFNAVVASGYLLVGAALGFGDWPALFARVNPAVLWRLPAAVIAAAGLAASVFLAAGRFRALAGHGVIAEKRLRRRALVSACGAATVACLAEIVGGRALIMPLVLALGCTLGVGLALTAPQDTLRRPGPADRDLGPVARAPWAIAAALAAGIGFVALIGPGLVIQP